MPNKNDFPEKQAAIDEMSPIPKYYQLVNILKTKYIDTQKKKLPTYQELMKEYSVSLATVKQAVEYLKNRGMLTTVKGGGIYVGSSKKIKLRIKLDSVHSLEVPVINDLIKRYEAHNRNVEVEFCDDPEQCDLCFAEESMIHYNCSRAGFHDLGTLIEKDLKGSGRLHEKLSGYFLFKGHMIAVPLVVMPVVLYYNKKLFKKESIAYPTEEWRWTDFLETAQKLTKDKDGIIRQYGFLKVISNNRWPLFVITNGGRIYDETLEHTFVSKPRCMEGLVFFRNLFSKYGIAAPDAYPEGNYDLPNLFAQGKTAMSLDSFYQYRDYYDALGEDLGITIPPWNSRKTTLLLSLCAFIPENARHCDESLRLLKFLLKDETQTYIIRSRCGLPVAERLLKPEILSEYTDNENEKKNFNLFLRCIEIAVPYVVYPKHPEMGDRIHREFTLLWTNMQSVEKTVAQVEEILASNGNQKGSAV